MPCICPCMQSMKSHFPAQRHTPHSILISIFGLHVRTRGGRGYHLRGLYHALALVVTQTFPRARYFQRSILKTFEGRTESYVPGPLTLRIMLRVVSSMNSTRTWVTPPREPSESSDQLPILLPFRSFPSAKLNVPVRPKTRVTLTNLTGTFDESILAI